VQRKFLAHALAEFSLHIIDRNSDSISDTYHPLEICGNPRSIHKHSFTRHFSQRLPCQIQCIVVPQRYRFSKPHKFGAKKYTLAGSIFIADNPLQVNVSFGRLGAHTEHRCMSAGSVKTLIDRRNSTRHQLDLHSVDATTLRLIKISHGFK
jgi:hypothetical protein